MSYTWIYWIFPSNSDSIICLCFRVLQGRFSFIEPVAVSFLKDIRDLTELTVAKMDVYMIINVLQLLFCVMLFTEGMPNNKTPLWLHWKLGKSLKHQPIRIDIIWTTLYIVTSFKCLGSWLQPADLVSSISCLVGTLDGSRWTSLSARHSPKGMFSMRIRPELGDLWSF